MVIRENGTNEYGFSQTVYQYYQAIKPIRHSAYNGEKKEDVAHWCNFTNSNEYSRCNCFDARITTNV